VAIVYQVLTIETSLVTFHPKRKYTANGITKTTFQIP